MLRFHATPAWGWAFWGAGVTLLCMAMSSSAWARDLEFTGPEAMSFGQAWRSIGHGIEGPLYNPAGILQDRSMQFTLAAEPQAMGKAWGLTAAVMDGILNPSWGGYLGFTYQGFRDFKGRTLHRFVPRFASSFPLYERMLFIGFGIKYVYMEHPGFRRTNGADIDLGMLFAAPFGLRLGVVGYNLIKSTDLLKTLDRRYAKSMGYGISYTMPQGGFHIAFDMNLDFDATTAKYSPTITYMAGLGWKAPNFAVRAGYILKPLSDDIRYGMVLPHEGPPPGEPEGETLSIRIRPEHFVTVGGGYRADTWGVFVGAEIGASNPKLSRLSLNFQFYFDEGPGGPPMDSGMMTPTPGVWRSQ